MNNEIPKNVSLIKSLGPFNPSFHRFENPGFDILRRLTRRTLQISVNYYL